MKTRVHYGEEILNQLSSGLRSRDEKIDIREVYATIDHLLNQYAKEGFLENWKLGFGQTDELWTTRFEWIQISDPTDDGPSYFATPAHYVPLSRNGGVSEVYFKNDFSAVTKKYFDTVLVISQKDSITYRNNLAGSLQGRLSVYPSGPNLVFNQPNVGAIYGDVGCRLVIKSSSDISDSAPFPIPADYENRLIQDAVQLYLRRRMIPADLVRDKVDKP